jgi:hypothetical protein
MSGTSRTWSSFALPPGEFKGRDGECGIQIRRSRSRPKVEQFYLRFCLPDANTVEASRDRFGGDRLMMSDLHGAATDLPSMGRRMGAERMADKK